MTPLKSKPLTWAIVVMTQSYVTDRSHLRFFLNKKKNTQCHHPSPLLYLSRTYYLTLSGSSLHASVVKDKLKYTVAVKQPLSCINQTLMCLSFYRV